MPPEKRYDPLGIAAIWATGSGTWMQWKAAETHQLYSWMKPEDAVFGETWEAAMRLFPESARPWRGKRLPEKWARAVVPLRGSEAVIGESEKLVRMISLEVNLFFLLGVQKRWKWINM